MHTNKLAGKLDKIMPEEKIILKHKNGEKIVGILTKPDGMPKKLLDVSRLHTHGWRHKIGLETGIQSVVADFEARYPG